MMLEVQLVDRNGWTSIKLVFLRGRVFFISLEQEGLGYNLFEGRDVGPVIVGVKSWGARIPRSDFTFSHPASCAPCWPHPCFPSLL